MFMNFTYEYDTHYFLYVVMYKVKRIVTGTIYITKRTAIEKIKRNT